MRRRPTILAAALIAVTLFALPVGAEVAQVGYGAYVAGLPTESLTDVVARQRARNWCWAACVQMVLNYHHVPVQQEEIVERIYGREVDAAANQQQILSALNGWAVEENGRQVRASTYGLTPSSLVRDLADRRPLIAGLVDGYGNGHAVVLTAVYYQLDNGGRPWLTYAVVRDPWPGSPSRQTIPWAQFASHLAFLVRVGVQ